MAPVEHVVADAGAFLWDVPLQDIRKNLSTSRRWSARFGTKPQRRQLAVLPYELQFKEPSPEYMPLVTAFSKKTRLSQSLCHRHPRVGTRFSVGGRICWGVSPKTRKVSP